MILICNDKKRQTGRGCGDLNDKKRQTERGCRILMTRRGRL